MQSAMRWPLEPTGRRSIRPALRRWATRTQLRSAPPTQRPARARHSRAEAAIRRTEPPSNERAWTFRPSSSSSVSQTVTASVTHGRASEFARTAARNASGTASYLPVLTLVDLGGASPSPLAPPLVARCRPPGLSSGFLVFYFAVIALVQLHRAPPAGVTNGPHGEPAVTIGERCSSLERVCMPALIRALCAQRSNRVMRRSIVLRVRLYARAPASCPRGRRRRTHELPCPSMLGSRSLVASLDEGLGRAFAPGLP